MGSKKKTRRGGPHSTRRSVAQRLRRLREYRAFLSSQKLCATDASEHNRSEPDPETQLTVDVNPFLFMNTYEKDEALPTTFPELVGSISTPGAKEEPKASIPSSGLVPRLPFRPSILSRLKAASAEENLVKTDATKHNNSIRSQPDPEDRWTIGSNPLALRTVQKLEALPTTFQKLVGSVLAPSGKEQPKVSIPSPGLVPLPPARPSILNIPNSSLHNIYPGLVTQVQRTGTHLLKCPEEPLKPLCRPVSKKPCYARNEPPPNVKAVQPKQTSTLAFYFIEVVS